MKVNRKSVLLIAFVILCSVSLNVAADDNINWIIPKTPAEVAGTWEGSSTIYTAAVPANSIPESSMELSIILVYSEGSAAGASNFKVTVKIDLDKFMDDFMNMPSVKTLGVSKDVLWELMCMSIGQMDETLGSAISIGKYYISYTMADNANEFILGGSSGNVYISSDRTKMKLESINDLSQGLSKNAVYEIILIRK